MRETIDENLRSLVNTRRMRRLAPGGPIVRVFRQAARVQTPASLRISSQEPRRLTFVSGVSQLDGRARVRLSPIAGPIEPGTSATLDFRVGDQDLMASGTVEAFSGGEALLVVTREPTARPPRARRVTPQLDSTVAMFVAEGAGLGRSCLPVLDISLRALRVLSTVPLEPGTVLRRLQVVQNHRVVREAEGVVLGSSPVLRPDGHTTHHASVRLRAPTQVAPANDPAELHQVTAPSRVRAILWALSDLSHAITLRCGQVVHQGKLQPIKGSREQLPLLRCVFPDEAPTFTGAVQIECALYGSGYRFYARVRAAEGRVVYLSPAPVVCEWHRREEERLAPPDELVATVEYLHPIDGAVRTRRIVDISVNGFGLEREPDDEALWPGLPLDGVRIRLGDTRISPPEVIVRNVGAERAGFQIAKLTERQADHLRVALMQIAARPIELDDGKNLDAILDFHRAVNLFEPDMAKNLEASLDATRRGWRIGHNHPESLMRTAFLRWKNGIGATLNLVRAYDSTWVMQHMAVASPAVPGNLGMLYSTLVRLTIPRADGQYVCGFIADDAKSQHGVMREFFEEWSTPEYREATNFVLYSAETRAPKGPAAGTRKLRTNEEPLVENAANRIIPGLCARALELRAGKIRIPSTRKAFKKVGLERGREAWGSFDGSGTCKALMLREWASPGLSLSSLLSASILVPVDKSGAGIAELCDVMLRERIPGDPGVRFMLVPEAADVGAQLEAAGMKRVAGCTLYAMHRYGLNEYQRYVASRYGFLHGRLRARTQEAVVA